MIIERTKIITLNGKTYVDIRSYEIEEAKRRKKPIMVLYNGEGMEIKDFRKKRQIDKTVHQMKFPPYETYRLYSFEWKPTVKKVNYKVA